MLDGAHITYLLWPIMMIVMNKIVIEDDHDNEDGKRQVVILKANKVRKLFTFLWLLTIKSYFIQDKIWSWIESFFQKIVE